MEQSPRTLAPRIDESLWEHHRDTIHRLYITKDRKLLGYDGVMQVMAREHSFVASKTQYEARFKRWNMRKKIKEREWNAILPRVEERVNSGRETQVEFNGMFLCKERLARELARRRSSKSLHIAEAQGSRMPPGFAIQSPPSTTNTDEDDSSLKVLQDATSSHPTGSERTFQDLMSSTQIAESALETSHFTSSNFMTPEDIVINKTPKNKISNMANLVDEDSMTSHRLIPQDNHILLDKKPTTYTASNCPIYIGNDVPRTPSPDMHIPTISRYSSLEDDKCRRARYIKISFTEEDVQFALRYSHCRYGYMSGWYSDMNRWTCRNCEGINLLELIDDVCPVCGCHRTPKDKLGS